MNEKMQNDFNMQEERYSDQWYANKINSYSDLYENWELAYRLKFKKPNIQNKSNNNTSVTNQQIADIESMQMQQSINVMILAL